jgi:hypothetical protein
MLHLHATHSILVVGVNELNVFIDLSNEKRALPPRPH